MRSYLLRRLGGVLLAMIAVSFLTYVGLTFAPGDAAEALIGEYASAEQIAALRQQMRLDAPLQDRYAEYMVAVVTRGDLGQSLISGRHVAELVAERFPSTLILAFTAIGLATLIGFSIGVLAATRHGSGFDVVVMAHAALGLALPPYWVALILVQIFAVHLDWLPVFGSGSVTHLILPAITLALPGAAAVSRLVRSSVLEVTSADFVRTAFAKGLMNRQIMLRHILPNSLIPALTLLGLNFGHLVGGAFVIETIFAWPGLGRLTVQAIYERDIPVVMGAILVVVPFCLAINLIVDLLHATLDPRLRQKAI